MKTQTICNALMECKNKKELNYVVRKYGDEIIVHPGLRQMLKSTIKRLNAVDLMKQVYQTN